MKVIVFGGAGFLGSHVVDELESRGHLVTIFDLKHGQDIMKFDEVAKAIEGQDIVYNFAGFSDLARSKASPFETLNLNVMGNLNILTASAAASVKRYVYASTVYVFSKKGSYYGISKQAAERCIEEAGVPFTILRYGTVYGPRSDEKNRIYRMLFEAITTKEFYLDGTGQEEREFIHAKDAARLSVDILDRAYASKHIMLTGNDRYTYKSLVKMIWEITGSAPFYAKPEEIKDHYETTPHSYQPPQSLKLMANPYIDLGQGLLETIEDISARLNRKS